MVHRHHTGPSSLRAAFPCSKWVANICPLPERRASCAAPAAPRASCCRARSRPSRKRERRRAVGLASRLTRLASQTRSLLVVLRAPASRAAFQLLAGVAREMASRAPPHTRDKFERAGAAPAAVTGRRWRTRWGKSAGQGKSGSPQQQRQHQQSGATLPPGAGARGAARARERKNTKSRRNSWPLRFTTQNRQEKEGASSREAGGSTSSNIIAILSHYSHRSQYFNQNSNI